MNLCCCEEKWHCFLCDINKELVWNSRSFLNPHSYRNALRILQWQFELSFNKLKWAILPGKIRWKWRVKKLRRRLLYLVINVRKIPVRNAWMTAIRWPATARWSVASPTRPYWPTQRASLLGNCHSSGALYLNFQILITKERSVHRNFFTPDFRPILLR